MIFHLTGPAVNFLQCFNASYYPGQKNRSSRDIHEIDPQCDRVISCDIDFNPQGELVMRRAAGRVDVEPTLDIARYHMIEL